MSKIVITCGECENCLKNRYMANCLPFPCTRGYKKEDLEPYIGFSLTNIFGVKKTIIYPSYQEEPMYPKETATTTANSESKIDLVITSQNYTLENIGIINKNLTILADKLGIILPPSEPVEDLNLRDRTVFDVFREKSGEHNYLLRRMLNAVEYINDTIENRLGQPREIE